MANIFDSIANVLSRAVLDSNDKNDPLSIINSLALNDNALTADSAEGGDIDNLEGGYYYKTTGEYLDRLGKSENVYVTDSIVLVEQKNEKGDVIKDEYKKPILIKKALNPLALNLKHRVFKNNCYLIYHESSLAGNEETALWIAHTVNNALKLSKYNRGTTSFNQLFKTGYSSAKDNDKNKQLSELLKSNMAIFCRKAMISVLLNKPAPSSKTYFWDGMDFVSDYGGKTDVLEHPKFKQYLSVTLEREIIQSAIDFWSIDGNKKKINPNANILVSSFEITSGVTENDLGFKTSTSEVFSGYRKDTLKIKKATENLEAVDFKSGTIFWTTNKN